MKAKKLVVLAMLVAIGFALHSVIPGVILGMKFDMTVVMMFIGILLFRDFKTAMILGIVTGILSALTTQFPNGQIPNMIDKVSTSIIFYGLVLFTSKIKQQKTVAIVLTTIGTCISGFIFLSSALLLFGGLPDNAGLIALILGIVIPTAVVNSFLMSVMYPLSMKFIKIK